MNIQHDQLNVESLLAWGAAQPWAQAMAQCIQEPLWHKEGDVWAHTSLVCRALEGLDDWKNVNTLEKNILLWAALLHDCGKPMVTKMENGIIRSKNHGLKGAYLARKILRDNGIEPAVRERIVNLVRCHNRPGKIFKPDPDGKTGDTEEPVAVLSWQVEPMLLTVLAKADIFGAVSDDRDKRLERIERFVRQARKLGCFDAPFRTGDDHARFLYFLGDMKWDDYRQGVQPGERFSCTVTLMSGLPGAGKDYYLSTHRGKMRGPVVSLDQLRQEIKIKRGDNQDPVIHAARNTMKEHLAAARDFVFNAVNCRWQWRRDFISLFRQYRARVEIVYIEPPWQTLLARNENRPGAFPEYAMHAEFDVLDVPSLTECHAVHYIY